MARHHVVGTRTRMRPVWTDAHILVRLVISLDSSKCHKEASGHRATPTRSNLERWRWCRSLSGRSKIVGDEGLFGNISSPGAPRRFPEADRPGAPGNRRWRARWLRPDRSHRRLRPGADAARAPGRRQAHLYTARRSVRTVHPDRADRRRRVRDAVHHVSALAADRAARAAQRAALRHPLRADSPPSASSRAPRSRTTSRSPT